MPIRWITRPVFFNNCGMPYSLRPNARFILVFNFAILVLFAAGCKKKPAPPPPPEVQVITLAPTNVPIFEEWIGTLDGFVNAQIHAQVTGYLLTQNYAEGSEVKKAICFSKLIRARFKPNWIKLWRSSRRTKRKRAKRNWT
jgi:hypothetical protein